MIRIKRTNRCCGCGDGRSGDGVSVAGLEEKVERGCPSGPEAFYSVHAESVHGGQHSRCLAEQAQAQARVVVNDARAAAGPR